MSGEAMMQDGTKHVYHSIVMEEPGAVTMSDKPCCCCAGGRKVMTLLLASALLWVVVMDITLVVYKSHHPGLSGDKGPLDATLDGEVAILRVAVAPSVANSDNSSIASPPPGNETGHRQGSAEPEKREGPGQRPGKVERSAVTAKPGRNSAGSSAFQDWLSRLRHRPQTEVTSSDHHMGGPPAMPAIWGRIPPIGRRPWLSAPAHRAPFHRGLGSPVDKQHDAPTHSGHDSHETGDHGIDSHLPGKHGPWSRDLETHGPWGQNVKGIVPMSHEHDRNAPEIHDLSSRSLHGQGPAGQGPWGHAWSRGPEPRGPQGHGSGDSERGSAGGPTTAAGESAFLVRFFSAIVDAPWNLTSPEEAGRHPPLPLPPPPPPPPPPPFIPGRFINMLDQPSLNPISILSANDIDDSDEAIFDIDISD